MMSFWLYIGLCLYIELNVNMAIIGRGFTDKRIHKGLATYYISSNASFTSSFCGSSIVNRVSMQGAVASLSSHYFKISDDYDTPFAFLGPSEQHPLCMDHGCIQVWPSVKGPDPPPAGDKYMTVAKITDICKECTKDQIELGIEAFGVIGNCSLHVTSIYWRFVDCKRVVMGPIHKETAQNITYLDQDVHTRASIVAQAQKELSNQNANFIYT